MKNFIAPGNTLEITAGADIASGAGVRVGLLFGVAAGAIANGAQGIINLTGVYELPKVSAQAWTQGAAIYWDHDASGGAVATTATTAGNILIGVAAAAADNPSATGMVRLNGAAPAAATA